MASSGSTASNKAVLKGIRKSRRLKRKKQVPKSLIGRGVVSLLPNSIDEQLMGLAQIELVNKKFLKKEKINLKMIRENIYKPCRVVKKETSDMKCECFLTAEEEANGQWGCGKGCINRMLFIECGSECSTKERCTNKRFQRQLYSLCRVFRTEKKGYGIAAEVQINPGDFIMEYVGEVIDSHEFSRRKCLYSKEGNFHYFFFSLRYGTTIDSTKKGNVSRFINHSCDPNAETQKWTVNDELRIGLFSRKTIMPGEEITLDYEYERYGRNAQRCFCEASNCRGWIGEKPESASEEESDSDRKSSSEEESRTEGDNDDANRISVSLMKSNTMDRKTLILIQSDDLEDGKVNIRKTDKQTKRIKTNRKQHHNKIRTDQKIIRKSKLSRCEKKREMRLQEDPDVELQISKLKTFGLKNQTNTLQLSRLMVRAKLLKTRLNLLDILQHGEVPCRRLFLDYHGLRLLNGWINENGNNNVFRLAMLEALDTLPIPNKIMVNDSKIYQTIKSWKNIDRQNNISSQQIIAAESPPNEILQKRIHILLSKWDSLPEFFRIPKRECIEKIKLHEHEAEADCQTNRDRFGHKTSSRYVKPSDTTNGKHNNISTINAINDTRYSTSKYGNNSFKNKDRLRVGAGSSTWANFKRNEHLPKEVRREMFERKVALDKKMEITSKKRQFETSCNFFGLDKLKCNPSHIPFSENLATGEFFNVNGVKVPQPSSLGDSAPAPPVSTNPAHYELPEEAKRLPISWTYAITPEGYIYYINILDKKTQWEPPSEEQVINSFEDTSNSNTEDSELSGAETMAEIDEEHVIGLNSEQLEEYTKEKIRERRKNRYRRLVSVREISPRRDEDRLYHRIEKRKYKTNKRKIRLRREDFKMSRSQINSNLTTSSDDSSGTTTSDSYASLPIHEYLYSSDDSDVNDCSNSSLIDVSKQRENKVDELSLTPLNIEPSTSKEAIPKLRMAKNKEKIRLRKEVFKMSRLQINSNLTKSSDDSSGTTTSDSYVNDCSNSSLIDVSKQSENKVVELSLTPLTMEPSTSKGAVLETRN